MINKIELSGNYKIIVENDEEKQKTIMGIDGWNLMFLKKEDVINHITLLNKALEFWEFDSGKGE